MKYEGELFIGMLTMNSDEDERRRVNLNNTWLPKLKENNYEYIFVLDGDTPMQSIPVNKSYVIKNHPNFDRAAKRLSLCAYFYYHTNFKWIWVATEDIYVNIDRLSKFVSKLEQKHNTEKDVVVFGNAVGKGMCFLQGGIGAIFSRAAAKKFIDFGIEWLTYHVKVMDDVDFNAFLDHAKINPADCEKGGFIGHELSIHNINASKLPYFENSVTNAPCGRVFKPIDKIFGIHQSGWPYGRKTMEEVLKHEGQNIMYYGYDNIFSCCKFKFPENLKVYGKSFGDNLY